MLEKKELLKILGGRVHVMSKDLSESGDFIRGVRAVAWEVHDILKSKGNAKLAEEFIAGI